MEKEKSVSLWIGKAESDAVLREYVCIRYTEDGDWIPPQFARDYDIEYYDDDFFEAGFFVKPQTSIFNILNGSSYESVIIPKFITLCEGKNQNVSNICILLFNYQYSGHIIEIKHADISVQYIGSVQYEE